MNDARGSARIDLRGQRTDGGRRDEILDAAIVLFNKKGFNGTSIQDLASALGVTKAALYHYFDSKESLLAEIIESIGAELRLRLNDIVSSDGSPEHQLRAWLHNHVVTVLGAREVFRIYLRDRQALGGTRAQELSRGEQTYYGRIKAIVEAGIEVGSLRPVDPAAATIALIGAANWTIESVPPAGTVTAESIADGLTDVLLGGLLVKREGRT